MCLELRIKYPRLGLGSTKLTRGMSDSLSGDPDAVPQLNAFSFFSSRTLLVSYATVTPKSFSAFWCTLLVFYSNPVFIYEQLVIWVTAGQMENFTLMALCLVFFWLLQMTKILQSLSLILSSNSKVLWFDRWWLCSPSTRQSGCGTSTSKALLPIICCLVSIRSPCCHLLPRGLGSLKQEPALCSLFTQCLAWRHLDPWLRTLNIMTIKIMLSLKISSLWQNGRGEEFMGALNFPL